MANSLMQAAASDPAEVKKSLELLFEYTKFHIGVYLTLTASYITVTTAKIGEKQLFKLRKHLVWVAIACFLVAGLAGGTIISSITQCECSTSTAFLKLEIGPLGMQLWKAIIWTRIEHITFWLGIIAAIASVKGIGKN